MSPQVRYGLPKIHKPDTPLRPIVSSCGTVLSPMVQWPRNFWLKSTITNPVVIQVLFHHVNSIKRLCGTGHYTSPWHLENVSVPIKMCHALIQPAVPVDPALNIIKDGYWKRTRYPHRKGLSLEVSDISSPIRHILSQKHILHQVSKTRFYALRLMVLDQPWVAPG